MEIPNETTSLHIKVIPRRKKKEFAGMMDDGAMKIRLKSIPEDGRANSELIDFLESETGRKWEIVSGWTSTRKVVKNID